MFLLPTSDLAKVEFHPPALAGRLRDRFWASLSPSFDQIILTYFFLKGKYHCSAELLFEWLGFDQTNNLLLIKQKQTS